MKAMLNTEAKKKEDGVVELFKKEMRNKIAQEAATFVMKKALEKLPELIARVV
jgi:predicted house-cleaning noncanonical NTP pyrophosphatase (MazG superfamily)